MKPFPVFTKPRLNSILARIVSLATRCESRCNVLMLFVYRKEQDSKTFHHSTSHASIRPASHRHVQQLRTHHIRTYHQSHIMYLSKNVYVLTL